MLGEALAESREVELQAAGCIPSCGMNMMKFSLLFLAGVGEAGRICDAGFEELLLEDADEDVETVPPDTHPQHQKEQQQGQACTQTAKHCFLFAAAPDASALEEKLRPRLLQRLVSHGPAIPWEERGQPGSPGVEFKGFVCVITLAS